MLFVVRQMLNLCVWVVVTWSSHAFAQQLDTLNVSYASVTGSRIPLWIAKDAGLFEKYGFNVNLVVIAAGNAAIGALSGGDVEVLGAPGTTTMVSVAKGLLVAIIGTFGPGVWKLAAHPSITSIQELRGKTVGISRPEPASNLPRGARSLSWALRREKTSTFSPRVWPNRTSESWSYSRAKSTPRS